MVWQDPSGDCYMKVLGAVFGQSKHYLDENWLLTNVQAKYKRRSFAGRIGA
jgi:hypothetical protein